MRTKENVAAKGKGKGALPLKGKGKGKEHHESTDCETRGVTTRISDSRMITTQGAISQPGKKLYRFKPGTIAMKQIREFQKSVNLLIPRAPFQRVIKEKALRENREIRFQSAAIQAIQEAAEAHITSVMEDSNLICLHANRVTLMGKDLNLARRIRGGRAAI